MVDLKTSAIDTATDITLLDLLMMVDVSVTTGTAAGPAGKNVRPTFTQVLAFLRPLTLLQEINTQVASYTALLSDSQKLITISTAAVSELTVPDFATVAWPTGVKIDVIQLGVGSIQFKPAGATATLQTRTTGSKATLQYLGSDIWHLSGDLAAVV